jgi:nucleoside-diphosphate-sugar epimerase
MNVTILGCGYVGTAVARYWNQQGLTVTATTTHATRLSELESIAPKVALVRGNDATTLRQVLSAQQVILLSVGAPNANAYEETYLQTAKTLVKVLEQVPEVQQVIYTGSYAVYGDRQGDWVTEDTPVAPANRNGEIMAETEQILLRATRADRAICVFRLGGIYGPGRELLKIFGRAAGTTRPGDGSDASNWVHLDDIVGAIEFARVRQLSGIYNLVQDIPTTTGTLLQQLFAAHHLPPVTWDATQSTPRPYNAKVSNQKLRTAGYSLVHPTMAWRSQSD